MIDWPSDETLQRWYVEENMTYQEIADRLGCSKESVGRKIRNMEGITPKKVHLPPEPTLRNLSTLSDIINGDP